MTEKWQRGMFKISFIEGEDLATVPLTRGWFRDCWGIDRREKFTELWVLNHLPTGYSAGKAHDRKVLMKLAEALDEVADWNAMTKADVTQELFNQIIAHAALKRLHIDKSKIWYQTARIGGTA